MRDKPALRDRTGRASAKKNQFQKNISDNHKNNKTRARGDIRRQKHTPHELELARIGLHRNEAEAVREHLVLNDARVVVHVHALDGHRRNLGDHDAAQRVRDWRVDADEVELEIVLRHGANSAHTRESWHGEEGELSY